MPVLSSKFQIVIPKEIREKHGFKEGDQIEFLSIGNMLQVSKSRPMKDYEGFLKGIDTTIERDEDDRL
jgi:AbrB family looped-hinge helix DNA binding protein